ncbi:MAG TPA: saccharopine dehydrogenase NADP-binding domain-containing protein, partial [Polyangiaceae bacterium]|nr:saccharopine dehydrogenase NADP-binding domain-containing protein [Polyangiaceae bacterium]
MPRSFDVVLWGATGFTGALVAEYLVRHHGVGRELRWALGGRSKDKLEKVRAGLEAVDRRARELPLLLGDGQDRASLDRLAVDASVVCSTVGPYALHGRELVAACVEAGTDYCDLTGEPQFVRAMIDAHHARATETGARIVHCCGYDSIPSDLGTLMLQERAQQKHGAPCAEVKHLAGEARGGMSGGTAASMVALMDEASRDPGVRRLLNDPYALDPDRDEPGPDGHDQRGVRWDADLAQWTGPFLMAAINTRVVRRTNALLGYAWGRDFRYREAMSFGKGPKGWLTAAGVSA